MNRIKPLAFRFAAASSPWLYLFQRRHAAQAAAPSSALRAAKAAQPKKILRAQPAAPLPPA